MGRQFEVAEARFGSPLVLSIKSHLINERNVKAVVCWQKYGSMSNSLSPSPSKSLTNIPLRTLGSPQQVLLSVHLFRISSQALTFFNEKKPHFLCENHFSTFHSLLLSKFQSINLTSALLFHLANPY